MGTILKRVLLWFVILGVWSGPAEASVVSDALAKARAAMQSAFQLSFLPKLPVVFHKDTFDAMMAHTEQSIERINLQHDGRPITRSEFQDDKALHIRKSAELALHIQGLIGSAHLAYGITMVVGLLKEAVDGSFLNPGGSRSKEDLMADHVGARAVFGKEKFDASLDKHLGNFVKPPAAPAGKTASAPAREPVVESPFTDEPLTIGGPAGQR